MTRRDHFFFETASCGRGKDDSEIPVQYLVLIPVDEANDGEAVAESS